MKERYDPNEIEPRWQAWWAEHGTFRAGNDFAGPKFYVLDMFPYPSGQGLHVGHPKGYVGSDIVARAKRMQGFHVLHPMGYDSFGLPAERQADKEGIHPRLVTARNTALFGQQLKKIGLSYDWDRELATSDPAYYRWTQWIFLKLYGMGLAYQAEVAVNWCPALNTVLANEEVKDGAYVETGDPVERRTMRQWMLRITAYAERLLEGLDGLDWPEGIKEMQRNWIGRAEGARVRFRVAGSDLDFEVFTTFPNTLFGCTYCVLAPEHPLVARITTPGQSAAVEAYLDEASRTSERDRMSQEGAKTGVFTGAYAVCPVNGAEVPIWVADYVLAHYGTGAVFGCPAHDARDWEFAKKFGLDIVEVVAGGDPQTEVFLGDGPHVNSEFLDGLDIAGAKKRVVEWLEEQGAGRREVNYRLRDWLFSRQRYWGEPIPIVHTESGRTVAVPEADLPVVLPDELGSEARGDEPAPLARAGDWLETVDPETGENALREVNTMPQWAGSCWYYLRFVDPWNQREPWDRDAESRWMPVDLYVGGAEHATLHLLYARFWHKVLFDLGLVSTDEPFMKLFNQGMVHARSFRDRRGKYHYPEDVEERDGTWVLRATGEEVETRIEKMSKSRSNVVNPDEIIARYGADSLRLYEVFMGPLEEDVLWQTEGLVGLERFLHRVWAICYQALEASGAEGMESEEAAAVRDPELDRALHVTIKKVTEDIEKLRFNTAISQLMIFSNEARSRERVPLAILDRYVRLLSPFAPHIAEELWRALGHGGTIAFAPWPAHDPAKCVEETVTLVVQVNGKLRARLELPRGSGEADVQRAALAEAPVQRALEGMTLVKTIHVPDKLLNLVAR